MKHLKISTLLTAVILLGCKGNPQPPSAIDSTQISEQGIEVLNLDNVAITAIQDRESQMDIDLFKGSYDDSLLIAQSGDKTSFPSSINVFLAVTEEHNVLFDAGLGSEKGGTLLAKLNYLKIKPERIDAIFLTHLHPDHIGGLLKDGQPVFPNATLYLSVEEFNAWSEDGVMKDNNDLWLKVLSSYASQIQPFCDGDTLLDGLVVATLAPGHTPGHTVYQIGDCLIAGDLIHSEDLQIVYPEFCARYDSDPTLAVTTRKKIIEFAKQNHLRFLGAHSYTAFKSL